MIADPENSSSTWVGQFDEVSRCCREGCLGRLVGSNRGREATYTELSFFYVGPEDKHQSGGLGVGSSNLPGPTNHFAFPKSFGYSVVTYRAVVSALR